MNWFIEHCTPANISIALLLAVFGWLLWKVLDYRDRCWSLEHPSDDRCPNTVDSTKDRPKLYGVRGGKKP